MLHSIKNYHDLCIEIDNLKEYIHNLERELYATRRLMKKIELDKAYDRFNEIERKLAILAAVIEDKQETRKKIIKNLRKLKGIDYKVVYLRDVRGLKLHEIAKKLKYSIRHVERISSRNKRVAI